jgi:predicted MPP superfamily phosphohydrolase
MLSERVLFRHFFTAFALAGGTALWVLACWFAAPLGLRAALPWHAGGPLVLAALVYAATQAYRRDDPEPVPLWIRICRGTTAAAFAAIAAAAALGATLLVCAIAGRLAPVAEASLLAPGRASRPGAPIRPLGTAAVGLAFVAVAYGYTRGHRRLRVREVTVAVVGLPPALTGLRLVHLSDLHVGPLADPTALREALARAVALDPDLVCVTGDVVDNPYADLSRWLPELGRLRARHGVFAILGNHDRRVGADRIAAALTSRCGWRVLRDEVATVAIRGARLHLLGLEHRPRAHAADALPAVLAQVPAGEPAVLLVHHPAAFRHAAAAGVPLTLAGHTHGGQIAVPGLPRLNPARLLVTRFDAGCFVDGASVLHVSRGLGASGQRVRIGVPREITVLTLVPARAAEAA